jgi:hypothetical protein
MPTIIEKVCENCNVIYNVPFKQRNRRFCSRECVNKFQTGSGNPAFGKTYRTKETHPEWAIKISDGSKGINSGDSNPMKRPEVRLKMSRSRSEMLKDESVRNKISDTTKKAWADGKFDGVRVGQCKWHEHIKPDGTKIKVQGTWELAFVRWADQKGLKYLCHRGRIPYTIDGKEHSYYPDFYVEEWQQWVDIKNKYHYSIQIEKFNCLRDKGINVKILLEDELKKMGVL